MREFYLQAVNDNIAESFVGRRSMSMQLEWLIDQFGAFMAASAAGVTTPRS